jgi:CDP-paratose 2-epimerase
MKKILVTGGAGFVGSSICYWLKENFTSEVLAFDNLKRRGSELSLARLKAKGVGFVHGDVRVQSDLDECGKVDLVLDCSAEPSVLAGVDGSPRYVIDTNLTGTINCLEHARKHDAAVIFLSTSRVYPIEPLSLLNYNEGETRFNLSNQQALEGASARGIAENFPLAGARSMYGATKLSSELIFREYIESYRIPGVINRCGVLTGPWQMGKVDQGVIVLWIAKHFFNKPLSYVGFGGKGKQVRDILHVRDLCKLLALQLKDLSSLKGDIFNIGGGLECSVSLAELTQLSSEATKQRVEIGSIPENRPNDIPIYLTDYSKALKRFGWKPEISVSTIVEEIADWIGANKAALEPILS